MNLNDAKAFLLGLKRNTKPQELGIIFNTSKNYYLYDTGTGKVAKIDQESAPIMLALFNGDISADAFADMLSQELTVIAIADFIKGEHLLSKLPVKHFLNLAPYLTESTLACEQLIIELTGKCNLRCKYCIYNDHYEGNRSFNEESINFETAKKAIDYAYAHRSPERFAVTFYGGEPLLNFRVMKRCIDYCLTEYPEVKTTFSLTTNLTLMTEEIAEYIVQVPGMGLVVSLDGPEEVQNRNRVFANGAPTFDAAFRGLKNLSKAMTKHGDIPININAVFMPPFTEEQFEQINAFFESLNFLPKSTSVTATYPAAGSVPSDYIQEFIGKGYTGENDVEWITWAEGKINENGILPSSPNLYSDLIRKLLVNINQRRISDEPIDKYFWNACCIPANRRLYLCTNGYYKLCEKIGESPYIGHVDTGVDFDVIKRVYLDQYEAASISDCAKCWAINLCGVCYSMCYGKNGIQIEQKRENCAEARYTVQRDLRLYYETLERYPEIIKQISKIERK